MEVKPHSEHWSSQLKFILAATGAAVGLGNIWKFPYMAGDSGGSAFVAIYIIFVLLIGIPILLAEMLIGRCGQMNPVDTLEKLAQENNASPAWKFLGWWGCLALLLILSFYSVVGSWSIAYIVYTISGTFNHLQAAQIEHFLEYFIAQPWQLLGWDTLFMILTLSIVARGVNAGIEKASTFMMPALFIILIMLVAYASFTPGFKQGANFLFAFNFSKITTKLVIDALGHALFTLAVGVGCMLTYASYLPRSIHLSHASFIIAILNLIVALLAGLAIFPIVFTYGLSPQEGPGLMFSILPITFGMMPAGQWVGTLFFILLLFAALSSSISLAEPLVILLKERYVKSRIKASIIICVLALILSIFNVLSFNVWKNFHLFHRWNIFTAISDFSTNIMLPIGAFFFALFAGWKLSAEVASEGINASKTGVLFKLWRFLIRYIVPLAIVVIFVSSII